MWRRSSLLKTQLMQLRKESLTKTKNSGLPRGIRTLTSPIPVQCVNQYVLYCCWTVSNISLYFTSAHLQCTYSEHFQCNTGFVYKKVYISKRAVNFAKFFSYGNSLMLTSIALVLTQKLEDAQHSITHKFNNTDTNKSKNSWPH